MAPGGGAGLGAAPSLPSAALCLLPAARMLDFPGRRSSQAQGQSLQPAPPQPRRPLGRGLVRPVWLKPAHRAWVLPDCCDLRPGEAAEPASRGTGNGGLRAEDDSVGEIRRGKGLLSR